MSKKYDIRSGKRRRSTTSKYNEVYDLYDIRCGTIFHAAIISMAAIVISSVMTVWHQVMTLFSKINYFFRWQTHFLDLIQQHRWVYWLQKLPHYRNNRINIVIYWFFTALNTFRTNAHFSHDAPTFCESTRIVAFNRLIELLTLVCVLD